MFIFISLYILRFSGSFFVLLVSTFQLVNISTYLKFFYKPLYSFIALIILNIILVKFFENYHYLVMLIPILSSQTRIFHLNRSYSIYLFCTCYFAVIFSKFSSNLLLLFSVSTLIYFATFIFLFTIPIVSIKSIFVTYFYSLNIRSVKSNTRIIRIDSQTNSRSNEPFETRFEIRRQSD